MKTKNNIGIPTRYKNRRYRSRLEAKWASFFDSCGWDYEYEPFDLDGWIPDFALMGKDDITLVEVKPIIKLDEELVTKLLYKTDKEILILGLKPFPLYDGQLSVLGWLNDDWGVGEVTIAGQTWDYALLCQYETCDCCRGKKEEYITQEYGFNAYLGSYRDRISGLWSGDHHIKGHYSFWEVELLWNEAADKVQWKK